MGKRAGRGGDVGPNLDSLKVPPQNLEAEQALLGVIFIDDTALSRVLEIRLSPDDFYREAHKLIFQGMREHFDRGDPVDLVTLSETLKQNGTLEKIGGPAYLSELADSVATAANVEYYAGIVRDRATLRRLITASGAITTECYSPISDINGVLDRAEASIYAIREGRDFQGVQSIKGLLKKAIGNIETMMSRSGGVTGVPSGYRDLDEITGGLQKSDLIILAGRPSMGKTALALNLVTQVALPEERDDKTGDPFAVAFFSLEMSTEQVLLRMLCSLSGLNLRDVRTGRLKGPDMVQLTEAASKLNRGAVFIDDTPAMSVLELRAKARRLKSTLLLQEKELGLIAVDYLQLMRGTSSDSREQEISEISRSLKALAKELSVPVLALSQLNRRVEERPDKRPMLADLRESGAIEQDADVIAFVYRGEYYKPENEELKGRAELLVRKQRNGPTGDIQLTFQHHCARFKSFIGDDMYKY